MNILFLSTRLTYPPVGGHFQRTFNLIKAISKSHDVYFVSFSQKNLSKAKEYEYVEAMKKYCRDCVVVDLPMERSGLIFLFTFFKSLFSGKPLIAYKYYCSSFAHKISEILLKIPIDFVHFDMLPLVEYRSLIKQNTHCILTEHNVEYLRYQRWFPIEKDLLKKLYIKFQCKNLKRYEIESIKKFEHCITVSPSDKNVLLKQLPNHSFIVIPNGTDLEYFRPSVSFPKPNTLVWVGGMTMWPNRDAIVYFLEEILPLLLKRKPNIEFRIIGNRPPSVLQKYSKKGIVKVFGFVDDIRPIVNDSMVYIAPLRIGSGTKLKILDAMAMGKAIVTTSIGAEGIDVQHGKDIMIGDTPESFTDNIITLLEDRELNRDIGLAARKTVETLYGWDKIGSELLNFYCSFLLNSKA